MTIKKYQPSNATEGDCFMAKWCQRCARDRAMREGEPVDECDDSERCDIILHTMAFKVSDPEYPSEWRYQNGTPACTAFIPAGEQIPRPRCQHTADLFGEPSQPTITSGPVTTGVDRDSTGAIGQP